MKVASYKCDGCGTMEGDLNHWFRITPEISLGIFTWQDTEVDALEKHYCSDQCAIKAVQSWLSAQKEAQ